MKPQQEAHMGMMMMTTQVVTMTPCLRLVLEERQSPRTALLEQLGGQLPAVKPAPEAEAKRARVGSARQLNSGRHTNTLSGTGSSTNQ